MLPRVVVTGIGLLTPVGNDLASTWEALCQGKSGVGPITSYDSSRFRVHFGAEIKNFDPSLYMDRKEMRRTDPYEQFAIATTKQALAQSGLRITQENADDIGVYIGSGIGGLSTWHDQFKVLFEKGPDRISPHFPKMIIVARARGAKILAELVGYGTTVDAYHVTEPAPGGEGLVRAIRRALQKAGLRPDQVDYINAHGTSTPYNDRTETQAIKTCFGEYAYRVPISSSKSMTGHTVGASGAIEAVISIMTILTGVITPTINLHHPDPTCDLDYVPNEARQATVNVALSNSMGFGGHNACLIFKRFVE